MLTSDTRAAVRPNVRREIVVLVLATLSASLIASPADPSLSSLPVHPMWVLALVLAARYGARGLWIVPALALGLVAVSKALGGAGELAAKS